MPTIVNILNAEFEECALERRNTRAKEIEGKLAKLRDPKFLLLLVGLSQVMELYCEVSLEGQYSDHLPSQVWELVVKNREKLRLLAEEWTWGWKDLKYVDIEAPDKIVKRLLEDGIYRPKVFQKNVMRKGRELREAGLLEEGQSVSSLFEEDEMVKALAGEILMEVPAAVSSRRRRPTFEDEDPRKFSKEDEDSVKRILKGLCNSLVKEWDKRMVQSPLDKAANETLGKVMKVELNMDQYIDKLKNNLRSLLDMLPMYLQEKFEEGVLLDGYCTYQEMFRELEDDFELHQIYQQWHKKYIQIERPMETSIVFSNLFECVQVRSTSEAICETIGSVMNNHSGKGRYLRPVNFNKEIFLEFNLGPTYLSENLVKEVYKLRKKDYVFKEWSDSRLVSRNQLTDERFGAAIRTFRKIQLDKSRFPVIFWE